MVKDPMEQELQNNTIHFMDNVAVVKVEPTEIETFAKQLKSAICEALPSFAKVYDNILKKPKATFFFKTLHTGETKSLDRCR